MSMVARRALLLLGCAWPATGCVETDDSGTRGQAVTGDGGVPGGDGGVPAGDGGGGGTDGGCGLILVDDVVATDAGQPAYFDVLANDPAGAGASVSLSGPYEWLFLRTTYDCSARGNCWVDAYPHESGQGWFTYQACNGEGCCGQAVVTVDIRHIPTQPYGHDDSATTDTDVPADIDVLANDNGNGGHFDTYSLAITTGPFFGTAAIDADYGSVSYTPDPGYRGSDVLAYSVCNTDGLCTGAWVYLFVDPSAPVIANADAYTVYQEMEHFLTPADNDVVPAATQATLTVLLAPEHGSFWTSAAALAYTGAWPYLGPDLLVYRLCADEHCAASTVRLTVRGNGEPTPVDDHVLTDEDHPISFNPLLNDTDPDGDPLHLQGPCYPGSDWPFYRGDLFCRDDGSCDFTPFPQEIGVGWIECMVCDELSCTLGYAELTVERVPNPPEGADDVAITARNTAVEIPVLANDAFNGGAPVPETMTLEPEPAHGTAVVDVDTGVVTYTPALDYVGPDGFTYHICDVHWLCTHANVAVTVQN